MFWRSMSMKRSPVQCIGTITSGLIACSNCSVCCSYCPGLMTEIEGGCVFNLRRAHRGFILLGDVILLQLFVGKQIVVLLSFVGSTTHFDGDVIERICDAFHLQQRMPSTQVQNARGFRVRYACGYALLHA